MNRSRHTVFANAGLLFGSCVLALLLLEQGFRCWLFGWQAFSIDALRNNVPVNNAGFMQQSAFDDIYWELKPDLNMSFKMAHLTTNHAGLADHEYSQQKPANTFRFAVLGDSYSMASGVDTDKSYHALIEKQLNKQATAERSIEFINFAVGGFGLERYNATLEHKVSQWQPDALLIGYCAFNDHFALPPKTGSVPPFNPPRVDGFWMSYVKAYFDMHKQDKTLQQQKTDVAILNEKQFAFIDQELARTRQLANQLKPSMPIVLAYLDNRPHAQQDIDSIRQIAQQHQMIFVDTTVDFANTSIEDVSIHLLDSHPNAIAQQQFANRIQVTLEQQPWLTARAGVMDSGAVP